MSKEWSLRLSLGSLGVEDEWVRGRWSGIRKGQGFAEPMKCRDLPLACGARAVSFARAWGIVRLGVDSQRAMGVLSRGAQKSAQAGNLVDFGPARNVFVMMMMIIDS